MFTHRIGRRRGSALIESTKIGPSDAENFLRDNAFKKMGNWELTPSDELFFMVKLSDGADAETLRQTMEMAAQIADQMETKLNGQKDAL